MVKPVHSSKGNARKRSDLCSPREVPSLTFFRNQAEYPTGKFQDISVSQEPTVKTVYELGIMNGQSENRFDPSGSLTVAEAVKMAAMVNNTYNGFNGTFPVQENGTAWYQPYVDYCVALGIMTGRSSPITTNRPHALRWHTCSPMRCLSRK